MHFRRRILIQHPELNLELSMYHLILSVHMWQCNLKIIVNFCPCFWLTWEMLEMLCWMCKKWSTFWSSESSHAAFKTAYCSYWVEQHASSSVRVKVMEDCAYTILVSPATSRLPVTVPPVPLATWPLLGRDLINLKQYERPMKTEHVLAIKRVMEKKTQYSTFSGGNLHHMLAASVCGSSHLLDTILAVEDRFLAAKARKMCLGLLLFFRFQACQRCFTHKR